MKITICGSIKNAQNLVDIYQELEKLGHEPQMHPLMFDIASGNAQALVAEAGKDHAEVKRKHNFIKYWYDLIVSGDAIVVGNFDKNGIKNYIGGNTLMEIGFAHVNNKKIFLYNPVPEELSYADEIKAMVDVILDGDLTKVK